MDELVIPDFLHKPPVYKDIFEQFVIDASFLWLLRSLAIEKPNYNKSDIISLERRIDAQLDGLMTSVEVSWVLCDEALSLQEPGEVFTAMILAMRSREPSRIKRVVEVGLSEPSCFKAMVSAMGWLPNTLVMPWITRFINGKEMAHKHFGLAISSIKRYDPAEALTNILNREECSVDEMLYARALRLVGELRRQDCMPALIKATEDSRDSIRFWSLWSAILLGQKFIVGRRYFLGKNIDEAWLKTVLSMGNQRQRHAAALELALGEFNIPLINTRAKVEYS